MRSVCAPLQCGGGRFALISQSHFSRPWKCPAANARPEVIAILLSAIIERHGDYCSDPESLDHMAEPIEVRLDLVPGNLHLRSVLIYSAF